ncbi:hypothetical protein [Streptomyces sp. NPDC003032]
MAAAPPSRTAAAAAAVTSKEQRSGVRSKDAGSLADQLLRAPGPIHREAFRLLFGHADRAQILNEVERETGSLYGLWADSPPA